METLKDINPWFEHNESYKGLIQEMKRLDSKIDDLYKDRLETIHKLQKLTKLCNHKNEEGKWADTSFEGTCSLCSSYFSKD